jgi:hypothetical protein
MNEFQKPFTETARYNYEAIFCPFKKQLGDEFDLHDVCEKCRMEKPGSHVACLNKFKQNIKERVKNYEM